MSTKKYEEFSRKKQIVLSKDEFCSMRDDKEKWSPVVDYLVGYTADAMPEFRFRCVVTPKLKPDPMEDKSVIEKKFGTKYPSFSSICKSCGKEFREHYAMPEFRFRCVVPPNPKSDPMEDKSVLKKKFGTKYPSFSSICKSCGKEFREHSGGINVPLCVVKLVDSKPLESIGIKNPNPKKNARSVTI